jgi:ankyrin repeat protein
MPKVVGADSGAPHSFHLHASALQVASGEGHEAIARLLIEHGADLNASGGRYGNALQAACRAGHENIVKLLLKSGADLGLCFEVPSDTE